MIRFLSYIIKRLLFLLIIITLLLLTAWNIPPVREEMVKIKDRLEEHYQVDIDKKIKDVGGLLNEIRGVRRNF